MINPEILEYEYMKPVKRSDPIRLFTNEKLERLAHTPPLFPSLVWLVLSIGAVAVALIRDPGWYVAAAFAIGVFAWSLGEYLLHRYVFHIRSERRALRIFGFMIHGIHHAQPMVESRLVMPLAAGIPIALVFLGIFWLVAGVAFGGPGWVLPIFGGFLFGYELYSVVHYGVHAWPDSRLLAAQRRHHLLHHGKDRDARFGVSSRFWDRVFGTLPKDSPRAPSRQT